MLPRLGVNIDHVATIRQQRGEVYPSVERAARLALEAGADQITIHLREDRRHIQDTDVPLVHAVCREFQRPLNFEMGCAPAIVAIAGQEKPAWVCLVPEKREERTTEGGLALTDKAVYARVAEAIAELKRTSPATRVSLFVEAHPEILEKALSLAAHAVEIHTGDYAHAFQRGGELSAHLAAFAAGHGLIKAQGWGYHAGHGLTDLSLAPLLAQGLFEEYNIGHWIVAEALFKGFVPVVHDLRARMQV